MKTYALNTRQICFIMIAYNAVSKLILYPNDLAFTSGNDLLFSALINFALQAIIVWAVAFLCSKTELTFFELLANTMGSTVAKIVICVFGGFFALSALYPIMENKLYVHTVFYDTIPSLIVFLPFFIFAVYVGAKTLQNAGRCADICLPIFAVALLFIFALSVGEFDFNYLKPVLKTPLKKLGVGALSSLHFFSEGAFMLAFMGKFKYKRGDCLKITLSYALGAGLVLAFVALFYGIFSSSAGYELYAISRVSAYFSAIDVVGRVDLIALYALEIVSLFYIALNIQLACECFCEVFKGKRAVVSTAVAGLLFALTVVFDSRFHTLNMAYTKWLWIAYIVGANALPLTAWLLKRKVKKVDR